jgi:hypothetical protein
LARRLRALVSLPLFVAVLGGACSTRESRGTDSNTNFLEPCTRDDECGSLICLCGQCSRTCEANADCSSLPGGVCRPNGEHPSACGADPGGACAVACGSDRDCAPMGLTCVLGFCADAALEKDGGVGGASGGTGNQGGGGASGGTRFSGGGPAGGSTNQMPDGSAGSGKAGGGGITGFPSGGAANSAGFGGASDASGTQSCQVPADCYPGIDQTTLKGTVQCLDRVPGGYCTHLCQSDQDCCAVQGECRTGRPQVCAPFESTGQMFCFLSCEGNVVSAAGYQDANLFCQGNANVAFTCRSTGGGAANRNVCSP